MLFEVYSDTRRLHFTEHEACIPDVFTQKDLMDNGYTLILDGKKIKKTDIKNQLMSMVKSERKRTAKKKVDTG